MDDARSFTVIGPGRVGLALVRALLASGFRCVAIRGRSRPREDAIRDLPPSAVIDTWDTPARWEPPPVVFLTVADSSLDDAARQLADTMPLSGRCVLHTSGLHGSDLLDPCMRAGATTASWHPLQSFASHATAETWRGVACAVEGHPLAVAEGYRVARAIGMRPWTIAAEDKPLYHAAAAVAGNLPHILIAVAREMMSSCGAPDGSLAPLAQESIRSALLHPSFEGLTGAIGRGDVAAVARHLAALPAPLSQAYEALASLVRPDLATSWRD